MFPTPTLLSILFRLCCDPLAHGFLLHFTMLTVPAYCPCGSRTLFFSFVLFFFPPRLYLKKVFFWGGRLFSLQFHFFVCLFIYLF